MEPGRPLAIPIESRAVARAMNSTRPADRPLLVGAAQANIGHSEAASGILAVMKAALMSEMGIVPASGVAGLKTVKYQSPKGDGAVARTHTRIATPMAP